MMKKRDIERIQSDKKIDELLTTETGRRNFWDEQAKLGARSSLIALLETTLHLPGDVIECGVFWGSSIWRIAQSVTASAPDKTIHALDSFEGFPGEQLSDADTTLFRPKSVIARKFRHANDVPARIEAVFRAFGVRGGPLVGYFAETLSFVTDTRNRNSIAAGRSWPGTSARSD